MLEGFNSVSHVQMYWKACEDIYLASPPERVHQDMIDCLVSLYSHVVEYQARVICHLSRSQLSRAWQNVTGWNNWSGKAAEVETLSNRCSAYIPHLQEIEMRENWRRWLEEMQESRTIFDKLLWVVEEGRRQMQTQYEDQKERDLLHDIASDYERGKDFNPKRVEGTCEWFFKD